VGAGDGPQIDGDGHLNAADVFGSTEGHHKCKSFSGG
jgi:hypothetical protein